MRHGEMSTRSAKDRQTTGRRQNGEEEPFLVEEISGSPVMRGRRQHDEEERFVVECLSGSPVIRGRRQNSEEERFVVENIPGSPVMRGRRQNYQEPFIQESPKSSETRGRVPRLTEPPRTMSEVNRTSNGPGWNLSSDATDGSARNATTISTVNVINNRYHGLPENDDAPPSYESSIPPHHIGWASEVTSTTPFPMPHPAGYNDNRLTFTYPSTPYPPIELSPLAKSYLSVHSPNSRSPELSISPSSSPSPDRYRPAYTHQQRAIHVVRTPMRPSFTRSFENEAAVGAKTPNDFSYRYGGVIVALFFVIFMMLLSLAVKFLIRNSFNQ